jgi:hypothetical protein
LHDEIILAAIQNKLLLKNIIRLHTWIRKEVFMEFATVYYDPEESGERDKAMEIKYKLGIYGVSCAASELFFDAYYSAPPTPWLEMQGQTYYANQIDNVIEEIIQKNAS